MTLKLSLKLSAPCGEKKLADHLFQRVMFGSELISLLENLQRTV